MIVLLQLQNVVLSDIYVYKLEALDTVYAPRERQITTVFLSICSQFYALGINHIIYFTQKPREYSLK